MSYTWEHLLEFVTFFAKAIVIIIGIIAIIGFALSQSIKGQADLPQLELERINDTVKTYADALRKKVFDNKAFKEHEKREKKRKKSKEKENKPKIYVVDFDGDIKATAVKNLRNEITTILDVATAKDEVVVRVTSPGGMVHTYGLAAAQLTRVRNAKIPLCVSVDKVAASGGYLMACTADKIIASPFAILGSIGVLAQVPNFHRLLKKRTILTTKSTLQEITNELYPCLVRSLKKGRKNSLSKSPIPMTFLKTLLKSIVPSSTLIKSEPVNPGLAKELLSIS